MKLHKSLRRPLFPLSAAVLLLTALCFYALAGLYRGLRREYELQELRAVSFTESAELYGIALRREQLCSPPAGPLPEDGRRLPAGSDIPGVGLTTESSALFFSDTDGFEFLSEESLEDMTPEALRRLLRERPRPDKAAGGRLIYGRCWYYAALCSSLPCQPEKGKCLLRFDGIEEAVEASLIYISPPQKGELFLLCRICRESGELLRLRKTGAQLIIKEYTGLQLPLSAVRKDAEGNDFVYTLTAGEPRPRPVEIIYSSGELCIAALNPGARELREGEMLIVSGEEKDEGRNA